MTLGLRLQVELNHIPKHGKQLRNLNTLKAKKLRVRKATRDKNWSANNHYAEDFFPCLHMHDEFMSKTKKKIHLKLNKITNKFFFQNEPKVVSKLFYRKFQVNLKKAYDYSD